MNLEEPDILNNPDLISSNINVPNNIYFFNWCNINILQTIV